MLSGHLREKNNTYYAVLNCKHSDGKRYSKWVSTGIAVKKGNKRAAEKKLEEFCTTYDEYGNLEGLHLFHGFIKNHSDQGHKCKSKDEVEKYKKTAHLAGYVGEKHEDNGQYCTFQTRKEKALHHAVDQHAPSVKSAIENKEHENHGQPEEKVEQRDMENTVCHDAVPKENR